MKNTGNAHGDDIPFQQLRPDPRTQTAEEYAKMSIDLFFKAVQQTREENRHKPIAASTEAMYRKTAQQLEDRHGSLEVALQWLRDGDGQSLRKTTFSNYRSSIRFMAEQRMDSDLLMAAMEIRQDPSRARKFAELKVRRDKSPSLEDLAKIGAWLYSTGMENVRRMQKRRLKADPAWPVRTYALLMSTYYCGLRPVEWEKAMLITKEVPPHADEDGRTHPGEPDHTGVQPHAGVQPFLHVVNAKTHYGKVATRDIPLADLDDDAMTAIRLNMDEIHEYLASGAGTADQYMRHCQATLRKAVASVFPKRKRTIQIYSARHACCARWSTSGMSEHEVSTLLGNDTITLKQYGGSRKKGGGSAHERALQAIHGPQESGPTSQDPSVTDVGPS